MVVGNHSYNQTFTWITNKRENHHRRVIDNFVLWSWEHSKESTFDQYKRRYYWLEALTPNHILLGSSQPYVEPINYENVEVNYRTKWRAVQAYTTLFWKRWLSEYLPTLSPRTKWTNKQQNFAVGDLVIVRNKNTPKSHWLLARIVAIYPGDDGIIRTVKIRKQSGEFVRSSQLLLLLEHSEQSVIWFGFTKYFSNFLECQYNIL